MKKAFIRFSSITHAYLARDTLYKYSINSRIGRDSNRKTRTGCGYVLYVDGDTDKALDILNREHIANAGAYRGDGL